MHQDQADQSRTSLADKFAKLLENAPVEDLRNNAKTWFAARLTDLDLVTRSDYDLAATRLARLEAKLSELEARLKQLEP